jgi:hypothetical protein
MKSKEVIKKRVISWVNNEGLQLINLNRFADEAAELALYESSRAAQKRLSDQALKKALSQTRKAIEILESAHIAGRQSAQTRHLYEMLVIAETEAGIPANKEPVNRSYFSSTDERWIHTSLEPERKNSRFIVRLEEFWFSQFGERPTNHDENVFFSFAAALLDEIKEEGKSEVMADAVRKQRKRVSTPIDYKDK